jgi:hypothetical protein
MIYKMREYSSNQKFYDHIDEIVEELRSCEHSKAADKIHFLLHCVAWTSASELFEELRSEFVALHESNMRLPEDIQKTLDHFIRRMDNFLNKTQ